MGASAPSLGGFMAKQKSVAPWPDDVPYPHAVPRIIHRWNEHGTWEQKRVDTVQECHELLETGWKLRPVTEE